MRTTIRLDDPLLRDVKARAARTGRTLTAFIEDALRQALATADSVPTAEPYHVPTFSSRLRPGVDLDSNVDLLNVMESA